MKRRRFVKVPAVVPAAPALVAQQRNRAPAGQPALGIPANPTPPVQPPGGGLADETKITPSIGEAAADPVLHFFTRRQFSTLTKVCAVLMPARQPTPGALDGGLPQFLDFLIGCSRRAPVFANSAPAAWATP